MRLPPLTGFRSSRVRAEEVFGALATLLEAGLPLPRALELLARRASPRWAGQLAKMVERVRLGQPLSVVLPAVEPRLAPPVVAAILQAGEAQGQLAPACRTLARLAERRALVRRRLLAALLYPAIVLVLSLVLSLGLLLGVVPRFAIIYRELLPGTALPPATAALLGLSAWLRGPGALVLPIAAVALVALWQWRGWRQWLARALGPRLPWVGPLWQALGEARATGTLAALLRRGVGLPTALPLAAATSGFAPLAAAWREAARAVAGGQSLEAALARTPAGCSAEGLALIAMGEETGTLPTQLERHAALAEARAEAALTTASALLEPLAVVALAATVGTLIVTLFLPLVEVLGQLGQR